MILLFSQNLKIIPQHGMPGRYLAKLYRTCHAMSKPPPQLWLWQQLLLAFAPRQLQRFACLTENSSNPQVEMLKPSSCRFLSIIAIQSKAISWKPHGVKIMKVKDPKDCVKNDPYLVLISTLTGCEQARTIIPTPGNLRNLRTTTEGGNFPRTTGQAQRKNNQRTGCEV